MTPPETAGEPVPRRAGSIHFRKRSKAPLPTPQESRRQNSVVRSAWLHFGEAAPVIAFLNTRHDALDGQPLQLAIQSDAGLERVETLLGQLTLKA
jgi:hypothetical protein